MQVIIEVTKCNNDRYDHLYNIRAVKKDRSPVGNFCGEYSQYVYHPAQVARAVKWVRDDVTRNEYVLDIRVNNMTAVEL